MCIEMLMWIAKDHIDDAQKLLDMAYECKHKGNTEMLSYLRNKAEERITEYTRVVEKINKVTELYKSSEGETKESVCWNLVANHYSKWCLKIKTAIAML